MSINDRPRHRLPVPTAVGTTDTRRIAAALALVGLVVLVLVVALV